MYTDPQRQHGNWTIQLLGVYSVRHGFIGFGLTHAEFVEIFNTHGHSERITRRKIRQHAKREYVLTVGFNEIGNVHCGNGVEY